MNKDIELAIDLAALTMISEMYPTEVNVYKVCAVGKAIISQGFNQPSSEMLIEALCVKYNIG